MLCFFQMRDLVEVVVRELVNTQHSINSVSKFGFIILIYYYLSVNYSSESLTSLSMDMMIVDKDIMSI